MPIAKFGIQAFLNHVQSGASGWVKFNIKPEDRPGCIGFETDAILADCDKKICLEFEPRSLYLSHSGKYDRQSILKSKRSIRYRRQKVDRFLKAVVAYANALHEALDEMERMIDSIPSELVYDSRKEA